MPLESTPDPSITAALQSAAAAINLVSQSHETFAKLAKDREDQSVSIALIKNDIQYIRKDCEETKEMVGDMKNEFVTHVEFTDAMKLIQEQMKPLKNVVYGLVGAILLAVIGGILNLVLT